MPKVSIVKCPDYDRELLTEAVTRASDLIGGIGAFVKRADTVLIKPNLLSARPAEDAVTSHYEFVRAVIRLVKGTGGRILVGDSPGSFFISKDIDHVYEKTGMKGVAREEGVELIKFSKSTIVNGFPIADSVLDADVVITVPKLKTHSLTVMTGAIKNSFGMIPGLFKLDCHRMKPKPKDFVKTILDVYQIRKPDLCIMDSVVAMEGNGPAAGRPRKVGYVMASSSGISLDRVASEVIGIPMRKNIIMEEALHRQPRDANLKDIDVVGEDLDECRIKGFKLPVTAHMTTHSINILPDFLYNFISKLVVFRPFIDVNLCRKCKICENSCPVDAITISDKGSVIDYNECIRCFCCHEACPYKAISIKKNFLTKLLWRD